jgi:hypothetical protein
MHRFLCLFFAFCSFPVFSNDHYTDCAFNESSILELLECQDRAILKVEEEKVYLRPDALVLTEQGIFVKTEAGKCLEVPLLLSSQQGCYTIFSQTNATVYPVIKCKNCKQPFNPNFFNKGKCPRCGTQN